MTSHPARTRPRFGVVVIGRNEGKHLARALQSAMEFGGAVVFADGASSDDSVAIVRAQFPDARVVVLDGRELLTPARGRNAGMAELRRAQPDVEFVQFLDGDCELVPGWAARAGAYLDEHPDVGIIAGRLRERDRELNRYHRLADMEWAGRPGDVDELGGIMVVRVSAWDQAEGQNAHIPAGEEREFCLRVRRAGWRVVRLADDMALHDIDMRDLAQWWARSVRAGHSYAQGMWVHRDRHHARRVLSCLVWGAAMPAAMLGGAVPTPFMSISILYAYRHLWRRMVRERERHGDRPDDARLYATAMLAAKVAGVVGVMHFLLRTLPAGRGGRRPVGDR